MKKTASEYYRNGKGNCAQAVAVAWHKKTGNQIALDSFAECGHGKAPDGYCGALHAVRSLSGSESAEQLTGEFGSAAGGHLKCREIRKAGKLSCIGCVEVAAELLEKHLDSK